MVLAQVGVDAGVAGRGTALHPPGHEALQLTPAHQGTPGITLWEARQERGVGTVPLSPFCPHAVPLSPSCFRSVPLASPCPKSPRNSSLGGGLLGVHIWLAQGSFLVGLRVDSGLRRVLQAYCSPTMSLDLTEVLPWLWVDRGGN